MDMRLRKHAVERIAKGTAPATRGLPIDMTALTLLHTLAGKPETASDALKLLHELQVHQVELDLQHEQAEQDSLQLAEDLKHYTDLFDLAPFGYLTLDHEGLVTGANRIATDWLVAKAGDAEEWGRRRLEDLVAPESRSAIRDMLGALRKGGGRQSCAVQSRSGGSRMQAVVTAAPGNGESRQVPQVLQVMMALMPIE